MFIKSVVDIVKATFEDIARPVDESHIARNIFSAIQERRTYVDAGIPQDFCTCQNDVHVAPPNNVELVKSLAVYTVKELSAAIASVNHK